MAMLLAACGAAVSSLCCSRLSLLHCGNVRRQQLQTQFGFHCACTTCTPAEDGGTWSEESDERRDRIAQLDDEVFDLVQRGKCAQVKQKESASVLARVL
jgi:hypothetical protein